MLQRGKYLLDDGCRYKTPDVSLRDAKAFPRLSSGDDVPVKVLLPLETSGMPASRALALCVERRFSSVLLCGR